MIVGTRVFGSHLMVGSVEPLTTTDMEEGEASCHYKKNGGDVDPDVTLAYIDEKIERILGHFQKDFEGGLSAENLGSKFGGYGTFLPTYERPPSILPHQKKQGECNAAPSPDNARLEGSSQNPKAPPPPRPEAIVCNTTSSQNPRETSGIISGRRVDSCLPSTKVANSCPSKVEADRRLVSPMKKGSLKFRFKICSDSAGLKNAAIYSGLGLDDSPFSSSENSSDASEGMLPISQCPPDESPTKIIEAMTSFPVPHEALISPLHDSLLGLSRKEKLIRETKPVFSIKDKKDGLTKLAYETNCTLVKKKKTEVELREMQVKRQNEVCASLGKEKTIIVNGKSETEAFGSKNFFSNELQSKPVSEGMKANANLDPQKKKLSHKATVHDTDTHKGSIKKEKPEIVGKKKLEVPQTAGGKIVGSFEKGFEFRAEASKCRKDTDSDTPESDNRKHRLKLHSNQKARASNKDSFNSSRLDENRKSKDSLNSSRLDENRKSKDSFSSLRLDENSKSKDVMERASGDVRKVKISDHSEIRMPKSSTVEPEVVALVDEWVCCDSCGKWRLLPFGKKPQLPEKWLCRMLNWLPGMNRCDISEEETTAKLYALYQLPLPQSGDVLQNNANGLTSGDASKQGKKNETLKEIQNPVSRNDQIRVKSSQKNQQLQSRKNSSLNGSSNPPNQLRSSTNQSSSDLHNSVEGKSRGQPKEKSTDRGGEGDIGLKHSKLNMVNKMQIPLKKQRETAEIISVNNQVSDKSDSTKKRKLKDWQDVQNSHNSALHEPMLSKDKSCERLTKKKKCDESDDITGVIGEISRDRDPKMQNKMMIHKQTSVGKELLKRKLGAQQVSGAANSSSSNVSQSHLTKAKFEVKVSSAESVSSSPMRTSIDQLRLCNNHTDNSMEPSHKKRKKVFPAKEFCNLTSIEKDKSVLSDVELDKVKVSDGMSKHSKKNMKYEPEVDSYHVPSSPNGVGDVEQNIPRNHGAKLTKKAKIHVGAEGLKFPQNLKGHDGEDQKSGALLQSNRVVRLQMKQSQDSEAGNKGGRSTVKIGQCKEEPSHLGGDSLRVSSKAGDSHQLIVDAPKSDVAVESKTLRDLGNAGNASNLDITKSSNQTACNTLKEAKKLRDNADNLKSAGFSFESNELYFQSALKYLYGAFLLETLNNASGKHGDMTHLQYYGITAELCEICALEYERCGEITTAALAFKCIEVAYLRIVYHKHSSMDGDRLEMESLFRTIVQGESPSSSASDVDNLSNQGAIDKATPDKKVGGGYIWNSANYTSFARILDFTRDMNSAMEASRKSRNAFAAASSSHASEGKHMDYVASVKKAIDFNFQDVGELVQLVRVATQTITHSSFRSGRD